MLLSKVSCALAALRVWGFEVLRVLQVLRLLQVFRVLQMLRALWSCGASDHLVLWIGDWSDLDAWMGLAGDLAESLAGGFEGA